MFLHNTSLAPGPRNMAQAALYMSYATMATLPPSIVFSSMSSGLGRGLHATFLPTNLNGNHLPSLVHSQLAHHSIMVSEDNNAYKVNPKSSDILVSSATNGGDSNVETPVHKDE